MGRVKPPFPFNPPTENQMTKKEEKAAKEAKAAEAEKAAKMSKPIPLHVLNARARASFANVKKKAEAKK